MRKIIDNILNKENFLYYSVFYLFFKYRFFHTGKVLTYLMFLYAILIFVKDIYDNKGIFKFKGYVISYLIVLSGIISCIVITKTINVETISNTAIYFINFFMYLPFFYNKDYTYVSKIYKRVFVAIIIYSFITNIIGLIFALFGKQITLFTIAFGRSYSGRLVTVRETANETAWFAIISLIGSIYLLLKNNKSKYKIFLIINCIVQIFTYILSGNRSVLVGSIFSFVVILYAYYIYMDNYKFIKTINILMLIIAIIVFGYIGIRILLKIGSDSIRFEIYLYAILVLLNNNILFGLSYNNLTAILKNDFDLVFNKYPFATHKKYLFQLVTSGNMHNITIQQLLTNGIIGFFILISFYVYYIKQLIIFIKNFRIVKNDFLIKAICIFFIVFGTIVGNISFAIIGTMTCFVNLFYFLSISAILQIGNK